MLLHEPFGEFGQHTICLLYDISHTANIHYIMAFVALHIRKITVVATVSSWCTATVYLYHVAPTRTSTGIHYLFECARFQSLTRRRACPASEHGNSNTTLCCVLRPYHWIFRPCIRSTPPLLLILLPTLKAMQRTRILDYPRTSHTAQAVEPKTKGQYILKRLP